MERVSRANRDLLAFYILAIIDLRTGETMTTKLDWLTQEIDGLKDQGLAQPHPHDRLGSRCAPDRGRKRCLEFLLKQLSWIGKPSENR